MKFPIVLMTAVVLLIGLCFNVDGANYEETVAATTTYASTGTAASYNSTGSDVQRERRKPIRNLAKAGCNLAKGAVRVVTTRPARTTHGCR